MKAKIIKEIKPFVADFHLNTKSEMCVCAIFHKHGLHSDDPLLREIADSKKINLPYQKVQPAYISYLTKIQKKSKQPAKPNPQQVSDPKPKPAKEEHPNLSELQWPPGALGDIAQHIYDSSVRPVREVSIASAFAFAAGICGRQWQISNTGLNIYLILLAMTGAGKEGLVKGFENLTNSIAPIIQDSSGNTAENKIQDYWFMGPSEFASGQGLLRELDTRLKDKIPPCFVSINGEFGVRLQAMCDPRANNAEIMLFKMLLDLYTKSSKKGLFNAVVYSDSKKNIGRIHAPAVSIVGETTPEKLFDGLDESQIASGLLPRFSFIEYTGKRPPINENSDFPPPEALAAHAKNLFLQATELFKNFRFIDIQYEAKAKKILKEYDVYMDDKINNSNADTERQLYNRAHLKALKYSGLLAAVNNYMNPVITKEMAEWAINFVNRDSKTIISRFQKGDIGSGFSKQLSLTYKAAKKWFDMSYSERIALKRFNSINNELKRDPKILPHAYLVKSLTQLKTFNIPNSSASVVLKNSLDEMVNMGLLIQNFGNNERGRKSIFYIKGENFDKYK